MLKLRGDTLARLCLSQLGSASAPSIFLPQNTPITLPLQQWKYQWLAYPILVSQTDQMC